MTSNIIRATARHGNSHSNVFDTKVPAFDPPTAAIGAGNRRRSSDCAIRRVSSLCG